MFPCILQLTCRVFYSSCSAATFLCCQSSDYIIPFGRKYSTYTSFSSISLFTVDGSSGSSAFVDTHFICSPPLRRYLKQENNYFIGFFVEKELDILGKKSTRPISIQQLSGWREIFPSPLHILPKTILRLILLLHSAASISMLR